MERSGDAKSNFEKAKDWMRENPRTAACYGFSAASLAVVAAPALVAAPLLGIAGFGANGIVAGSAAAAAQAGVGNVVAGSLFATMQSAGAAGAGLGVVNGVVQGASAMNAAVVGGTAAYKRWFPGNPAKDSVDGRDGDGEAEPK